MNVFAPAIVWEPVVISPLAVALAFGRLKTDVPAVVAESIAKSVPAVPTVSS